MMEFFHAGGWLMFPIVLSSVIAMAIIIERYLALRTGNVLPKKDIETARQLAQAGKCPPAAIEKLRKNSLVGRVLSVGLESHSLPRHVMKENIEEAGRHVVHDMGRYLTALGTIAAITPLMGLLGTVIGMIDVFSVITRVGVGSPGDLASGISQALITTAAGIAVAIVTLIFHRYFKARVSGYVVSMEKEAMRLIEIFNDNRRIPSPAGAQQRPQQAAQRPQQAARPRTAKPESAAGAPQSRGRAS